MRLGSQLTCFDAHYQRLDPFQVGLKTKQAFGRVAPHQLANWRLKQVSKVESDHLPNWHTFKGVKSLTRLLSKRQYLPSVLKERRDYINANKAVQNDCCTAAPKPAKILISF